MATSQLAKYYTALNNLALAKSALIELIVARKTKGAAFNPPPEGYQAMRDRIKEHVTRDLTSMAFEEFVDTYKAWLS
jgi:hypothetical protein